MDAESCKGPASVAVDSRLPLPLLGGVRCRPGVTYLNEVDDDYAAGAAAFAAPLQALRVGCLQHCASIHKSAVSRAIEPAWSV